MRTRYFSCHVLYLAVVLGRPNGNKFFKRSNFLVQLAFNPERCTILHLIANGPVLSPKNYFLIKRCHRVTLKGKVYRKYFPLLAGSIYPRCCCFLRPRGAIHGADRVQGGNLPAATRVLCTQPGVCWASTYHTGNSPEVRYIFSWLGIVFLFAAYFAAEFMFSCP